MFRVEIQITRSCTVFEISFHLEFRVWSIAYNNMIWNDVICDIIYNSGFFLFLFLFYGTHTQYTYMYYVLHAVWFWILDSWFSLNVILKIFFYLVLVILLRLWGIFFFSFLSLFFFLFLFSFSSLNFSWELRMNGRKRELMYGYWYASCYSRFGFWFWFSSCLLYNHCIIFYIVYFGEKCSFSFYFFHP